MVGILGKFTVYNDSWIDCQIQKQIEKIVETVLKHVNGVQSILLFGGFGRGEGSIKFVDEKTVLPLKDYDIIVIVKRKPDRRIVNQLNKEVYLGLGYSDAGDRIFKFSDFSVDLLFTTRKALRLNPDIGTYEMKVASYLLYGDDIRKEIPWTIADIPLSSGWRLLFEKMTGLIGHFPQRYLLTSEICQHDREQLIFECYKTYIEIATALCILMRCYSPSFSMRCNSFGENFAKKLPELHNILPSLPDLVAKATEFKFRPQFYKVTDDCLDLWFNTRDILLTVAKFYLEKYLLINIANFLESQKLIIHGLSRRYHEPIASAIVKDFAGVRIPFVVDVVNNGFLFFVNCRYILDTYRKERNFPFSILALPPTSITARMHSIAPLVLLSIKNNGIIDRDSFGSSRDVLLRLSTVHKIDSFSDLRLAYLRVYNNLYFH